MLVTHSPDVHLIGALSKHTVPADVHVVAHIDSAQTPLGHKNGVVPLHDGIAGQSAMFVRHVSS